MNSFHTSLWRGKASKISRRGLSWSSFLILSAVLITSGFFIYNALAEGIFSVSIMPNAVDINQITDIDFNVTASGSNIKTIAVSVEGTGFSNPTDFVCPSGWSKINAMPPILNGYVCDDPNSVGLQGAKVTLKGLTTPNIAGVKNFSVSAINTDETPQTENKSVSIMVKNLSATAVVTPITTNTEQERNYTLTITNDGEDSIIQINGTLTDFTISSCEATGWTCTPAGDSFMLSGDSLAVGSPVEISVTVTAPATTGTRTWDLNITGSLGGDIDLEGEPTVTVQTPPNIKEISTTITPVTVSQGQTGVIFSINVSNIGEVNVTLDTNSTISFTDGVNTYSTIINGTPGIVGEGSPATLTFLLADVDVVMAAQSYNPILTLSGTDDNTALFSQTIDTILNPVTVQTPADLSINSVTSIQDYISYQVDAINTTEISIPVDNDGQAGANITDIDVQVFEAGTANDISGNFTISRTDDGEVFIAGGGDITLTYDLTLTGGSYEGFVDVKVTIDFTDVNSEEEYSTDETTSNVFIIDNSAPTAILTEPTAGSYKGNITISANVEDNVGGSGVDRVEFYHASIETLITTDTEAPFTTTWDSNTVVDNNYNLYVKAYDNAGNMIQSAPITVTVDNTDPDFVSYTLQVEGEAATTDNNIAFSPNVDGIKETIGIDVEFTEPVDYTINIKDGVDVIVKTWSGLGIANPQAKEWNGEGNTGDGDYTIEILVTDAVGNSMSDTFKTITLDTVVPIVNAGDDRIVNVATIQDDAIGTDGGSGVLSILWTQTKGPGNLSFNANNELNTTISADVDGAYIAQLTITDNAGNTNSDTMNFTWDTKDAVINEISAPVADGVYRGDIGLMFTATDPVPGTALTYQYNIDGVPINTPIAFDSGEQVVDTVDASTGVTEGRHTLTLTITDAAGNDIESTTASFVVDNNSTLTVGSSGEDFDNIQEAIDKAIAENIIEVSDGDYNEGSITVDKSLTIKGNQAGVSAVNRTEEESIVTGQFAITADNVTLDGFKLLTGTGVDKSCVYMLANTSGHIIENNIIIGDNESGARGILFGYTVSDVDVSYNDVSGWHSGIYINPSSGHTIQNNNFHDNQVGIGSDGLSDVEVNNNIFEGNALEGWGASAVGINVSGHLNKFINTGTAVAHYSGSQINVENNWWGTYVASEIEALTLGDVDYNPWYMDEAMTILSSKIDLSEVYVDDDYIEGGINDNHYFGFNAFTTIQEGINAVVGSTVYVAAGTYNEDVTIDKSLTLNGAQVGVDARGRIADESEIIGVVVVASEALNVVFDGFKFTSPTRAFTPRGFNLHIESETSTIRNNIFVAEENAGHTYSGYLDLDGITDTLIEKNDFSGDLDPVQEPNVILLGISGAGIVTVSNNEIHNVGGGGGIGIMSTNAGAVINIENNKINNTGDGIWVANWVGEAVSRFASLTITGNNIYNNAKKGIKFVYPFPESPGVGIHSNKIYDNAGENIYNNGVGLTVDAKNNWWGTYIESEILAGISGSVIYDPWYMNEDKTMLSSVIGQSDIYVDDDYTKGGDNNGHYWGYNAFDTIQEGIEAVEEGGIVNVAAGIYNESLLIEKLLTLNGTGEKPIITGDDSINNYVVKINGTTDVTVNNVEVNGGGTATSDNAFDYGILVDNSGTELNPVEISNSIVKNIWKVSSNGIEVDNGSYVLIHHNTISSFHKRGIRFINSEGEVYNNEVVGDHIDGTSRVQNLVTLWEDSDVEIYRNTLHDGLSIEGSPTWDSPGIFVSAYNVGGGGSPSYANIYENEIYNCDSGIVVGSVYATADTSSANIANNNLHNLGWAINFEVDTASATITRNLFVNNEIAVNAEGNEPLIPGPVIDARMNWWGSTNGPADGAIFAGVDYRPWCTNEGCDPIDEITPTVSIDTLLVNDTTPALTGTVSDNNPVFEVEITVTVNENEYVATNNGNGTWTLTDNIITPALDDGTYDIGATAEDMAGNIGNDETINELNVDAAAPSGYTVEFDQDYANISNENAISFTFAGAETGTTYDYSIDNTNGETEAVVGNGLVSAVDQKVSGIDVSSLDDGELTLTVILTDAALNAGADATDVVFKDTLAPTFTTNEGTDVGPVQTDTINIAIVEDNAITLSEYGFSTDDTCNADDIYGNGFIIGVDFDIAGDHTDYLCVMATDVAENHGYQFVGQLNTDNTDPTLTLYSQFTNQTLIGGNIYPLSWTATDINFGANSIGLEYSTDNGNNWITIKANTENDGAYSWITPKLNSSNCYIRITATDLANNETQEESDSFAISYSEIVDAMPPTIILNSPNGSENIEAGSDYVITWTANDDVTPASDLEIELEYSLDGSATWDEIENTENDGAYIWTIPEGVNSDNCLIRITTEDAYNNIGSDISNAVFSITEPVVEPIPICTDLGDGQWTCDIGLNAGWNLISLPLIPDDNDIADVIKGSAFSSGSVDNVELIKYYDSTVDDNWLDYIPANGGAGDLLTMEDGKGYWVKMIDSDVLTVTGIEMPEFPNPSPAYEVIQEWNLIGIKSISARMLSSTYLQSLTGNYILSDENNINRNDDYMYSGEGYWLWANEDGTIVTFSE